MLSGGGVRVWCFRVAVFELRVWGFPVMHWRGSKKNRASVGIRVLECSESVCVGGGMNMSFKSYTQNAQPLNPCASTPKGTLQGTLLKRRGPYRSNDMEERSPCSAERLRRGGRPAHRRGSWQLPRGGRALVERFGLGVSKVHFRSSIHLARDSDTDFFNLRSPLSWCKSTFS